MTYYLDLKRLAPGVGLEPKGHSRGIFWLNINILIDFDFVADGYLMR